ncbi:MAG: hypothetical protein JXR37_16585 [Kiritimatiellae bacterium]|nr:hypothetical protein [Kiritimatiellia bacterium]
MRATYHLFLLVFLSASFLAVGGPRPHMRRTGENLFVNPAVAGPDGWKLSSGTASYDRLVSRTPDGSGSIRLDAAKQKWSQGTVSARIPVVPGKTYTFGAYTKSSVWPCLWHMRIKSYPENPSPWTAGRECGTAANKWEESANVYVPGSDVTHVELLICRTIGPRNDGSIWLDDFFFCEGVGFDRPPSPKRRFDGTITRFDELGNIEICEGGEWKPFFPFSICADGHRADWTAYAGAGFNCSSRASSIDGIRKAREAGLKCFFDIGPWVGAWHQKDYSLLAQRIRDIHEAGLSETVIMYYWDNETYQTYNMRDRKASPWDIYATPKTCAETIDRAERSMNRGRRLRPLYQLAGNYGMARMYRGYYDMAACYTGAGLGNTGGAAGGPAGLLVLDNIEGQDAPLFAQVNGRVDRINIYSLIIGGAKGFSFWKDWVGKDGKGAGGVAGAKPIELHSWYSELPAVRREVDDLLPIIRLPHWTSWRVLCKTDRIVLGTREYEHNNRREGYVIACNTSRSAATAAFSVEGLSYSPVAVKDYFDWDGPAVASFSDSSFTVTLDGKRTAVYRLVNPDGPGKPEARVRESGYARAGRGLRVKR